MIYTIRTMGETPEETIECSSWDLIFFDDISVESITHSAISTIITVSEKFKIERSKTTMTISPI